MSISQLDEFWRIKVHRQIWKNLLHLARKKTYAKGDIIFYEGEKVESLCYLETGAIQVVRNSADGNENILMHLEENTLFGETPFFTEQSLLSTFVCHKDAVVWFFSKDCVYNELLPNNPESAIDIIKTLSEKLSVLSNQSASLRLDSLRSRICKFIFLKYQENIPEDSIVDLGSIKMQEVASILGVHRISLYKAFKEMEKEGIIKSLSKNRIEILDLEKLTDLTQI